MKLVLEGLTGTGKSQTIAAMRRLGLLPSFFVPEDDTLGEVWDERELAEKDPARFVRRLTETIARIDREKPDAFALERFHFSYYALAPNWEAYAAIDRAVADLGASLVLLDFTEGALRTRSLLREEHAGTDWQGLVPHTGSEDAALETLRTSQRLRHEALARTQMRSTVIDTTDKDWERIARSVSAFAHEGDR